MAIPFVDGIWDPYKLLATLNSDLQTETTNHAQRCRWHESEVQRLKARIEKVENHIKEHSHHG